MQSLALLRLSSVCASWQHRPARFGSIGLLMVCCFFPVRGFGDESQELTKRLPNDVNALAIVRVEQVMQTPRARQEEWAKSADQKFLSGAGGIPSWVRTLVVGFLVRPASHEEIWAAGVATVPPAMTMDRVAQREQEPLEKINGVTAVRSRRDSYVLGFSPGMIGMWRPAVRQEAGRWARALEARVTGPLSEYLNGASTLPGHIVMAIDLENTLDPVNTATHLAASPQLASSPQLQQQLLSVLMSLRGVSLSITIEDKTTASLRIDFQKDIGTLGPHLQRFFLSTLHELGAAIDDFDTGTYKTEGASLLLTSALSDENLRRVVSLITSAPATGGMVPSAGENVAGTPATPTADASRRYFQQVDRYLNDLSKANRRATDYSRTALWHENFAAKIDELPVAGVDPALVTYGSDVSSRLRALGRSLRGQQLDVNLQQKTLTYDYDYNPGWASVNVWGGVGYGSPSYKVTSNLQQVRERQAAAISAGAKQRDDVWSLLNDERVQILRQMQQKYGPDFGKP